MPAVPQITSTTNRQPRGFFAFLILLALVLLSACTPGAARRTSAPTVRAAPTATRIIPPTYTPAPERTEPVLPTAAPEVVEATVVEATVVEATTEAPSSVSDPALEKVKLTGLSWLEKYKYNLLLSFDFPGPVDPADYRMTLEGKEYRCEVLAQYPNRLYCNGQGAKVLAYAQVQIYPAGSDVAGFEQKVWVPYFQ